MSEHVRNLIVIGGRQGLGDHISMLGEKDAHWDNVIPLDHLELDVRQHHRCTTFAENVAYTRHRQIDIVYCAGINRLGKLGELSPYDITNHFAVNVAGFINVLDAFQRTHGDDRVNVTAVVSDSSRIPMRGSIMYASSKAALAHAIRCAARELAPTWRVNGVSPGVIKDTPMTKYVDSVVPELRGWTLEEAQAYERSLIPMGRRVTKDEVANLVLDATKGPDFMTGSIIDITGGK